MTCKKRRCPIFELLVILLLLPLPFFMPAFFYRISNPFWKTFRPHPDMCIPQHQLLSYPYYLPFISLFEILIFFFPPTLHACSQGAANPFFDPSPLPFDLIWLKLHIPYTPHLVESYRPPPPPPPKLFGRLGHFSPKSIVV